MFFGPLLPIGPAQTKKRAPQLVGSALFNVRDCI